MRSVTLLLLFTFVFFVELKIVDLDKWKATSRKRDSQNVVSDVDQSRVKYRHEMFENSAAKVEDIGTRVRKMTNPYDSANLNGSDILYNFIGSVNSNTWLENSNVVPDAGGIAKRSPSPPANPKNEAESSHEIMETAEVYFRPLSRYRELQEKKKNRTLSSSDDSASSSSRITLLSKSPEYCLPAKGGLICFYKL